MTNHSTAWAQRLRLTTITAVLVGGMSVVAQAAPLGVPAATTGAGKTALGAEVNVLMDRDLTGGNGEVDGSQIYAKGSLGIDDRLDLDFRLGFGDFSLSPGGFDTDIGPAFGVGMRVTWATIPNANVKVGSVFQTTRIRAEESTTGLRVGWAEYDASLGVSLDMSGPRDAKTRQTQFGLVPYGGLAWSGLDLDVLGASEDDAFGLFLGLNARAQGNFNFGVELRLVDQTALSVSAGTTF
ncbi:MAG TPA: hypothetical protein VFN94_11595 [Nitrospiria bacterium]|nr:hypothetical protein [Nitrospiria bacterium]